MSKPSPGSAMRYIRRRLVRRHEMRTCCVGSSRPPHSMAFDSSSRNAWRHRLADVLGQVGVEVHHELLDAVGDVERARRHQLDPLGPCRHHLDRQGRGRRRSPALPSPRRSPAPGATGLRTKRSACPRNAWSSASGVSSAVIITTRGGIAVRPHLGQHLEAVQPRQADVEQHQVDVAPLRSRASASTPSPV